MLLLCCVCGCGFNNCLLGGAYGNDGCCGCGGGRDRGRDGDYCGDEELFGLGFGFGPCEYVRRFGPPPLLYDLFDFFLFEPPFFILYFLLNLDLFLDFLGIIILYFFYYILLNNINIIKKNILYLY